MALQVVGTMSTFQDWFKFDNEPMLSFFVIQFNLEF